MNINLVKKNFKALTVHFQNFPPLLSVFQGGNLVGNRIGSDLAGQSHCSLTRCLVWGLAGGRSEPGRVSGEGGKGCWSLPLPGPWASGHGPVEGVGASLAPWGPMGDADSSRFGRRRGAGG